MLPTTPAIVSRVFLFPVQAKRGASALAFFAAFYGKKFFPTKLHTTTVVLCLRLAFARTCLPASAVAKLFLSRLSLCEQTDFRDFPI